MKEVTYEDWKKNPTSRMMWVWDDEKKDAIQRKVIYFNENKHSYYPIITLSENGAIPVGYEHCAEIGKQRRMTNKELSRWLREKPTRECKWIFDDTICSVHTYNEKVENEEVHKDVRIREDDGDWKEPLVEEQIMFEKEAEDFLKKSLKVDDDEFDVFKNEASCKEEIKRLTDFVESREKRIAELEKENAELKSELNALKTSDY